MKLEDLTSINEDEQQATPKSTRIHNADIKATIKYFSGISGIPVRDLHLVGSTGKTPSSSDIDLALDSSKYDIEMIDSKLKNELGHGSVNKDTSVASYHIPIRGKDNKGTVRVDLMFGGNPNWLKFAYHSEGPGSKYKGAVRSILLQAVAAALSKKGVDHMEFDGDNLTIRAGRMVDLPNGLRRTFSYRNKNEQGMYDDKMTSVTRDEFKEKFPNIEISGSDVVIDDPAEFVKVLFGSGAKTTHVNSVEQIINLIKKKFDNDTQDKIFAIARSRAQTVAGQMRLPKELEQTDET